MKHYFSKFYALLAATAALSATFSADADHAFQMGLGYRQDTITWDVDGKDSTLPYLAEDNLSFRDLDTIFLGGRLKGGLGCLYYRVDAEYGWIVNGREREKGLWYVAPQTMTNLGDNLKNVQRTIYAATVRNHIKKRNTFDFDLSIGVPFNLCANEIQLTPMIGYSYNTQRVRVKDHTKLGENFTEEQQETIGMTEFSLGGHSNYRMSWWGPQLGFDMAYATCDCGTYYSEMEFHFARARRQRNSDEGIVYDNYQKTRSAYIFTWKVGASIALCDCWLVDASLKYVDGFSERSSTDKLNWRSGQVRVDAGYRF